MRRRFGADPVMRRARAALAGRGEQVTAAAVDADGGLLVTTSHALYLGDVRLPWDRVAKATWDHEESALVVVGSTGPGESARQLVTGVPEPGALVEMVRVAVTSNILVSQRIDSVEYGGAWVTARRVPGADEVRWTVVFDPGHDPRDPARRSWADQHVAALRDSTGV